MISVYSTPITNNNWCESFHSKLKCTIKVKSCSFWVFIENTNNIISAIDHDIQADREYGTYQLRRVAGDYTNTVEYISSMLALDGHSGLIETENPILSPTCCICLSSLFSTATISLVPCGHMLHNHCWNNILRHTPNSNCPLCLTAVEDIQRLYS